MRTMKALLVTAAVGAVGIATSMADPVYSANVVGFVNLSLVSGYNFVCNPLTATNNHLGTVVPTVPDGSTIAKWNAANQQFDVAISFDSGLFGGWELPDTTISAGEAFFLNVPSATTITFVGEVPQGNLATPLVAGYSFVGSQVPQAGGITSALGLSANNGDSAMQWDSSIQQYKPAVSYDTDLFGGWEVEPSLGIAEGVVLVRTVGGSWARTFSVQ